MPLVEDDRQGRLAVRRLAADGGVPGLQALERAAYRLLSRPHRPRAVSDLYSSIKDLMRERAENR